MFDKPTNIIKIFNIIKKHKNGGIIKYQNPSSPLLEKGYTTTNNEILQNPDTFNVNWYKYRAKQLQDVIKEDPLSAKYLRR